MFETSRLVLRLPTEDDLDPLSAINADPQVMQFIGDGTTRSREETAAGLARARQEWDERGFSMFAVDIRDSGQFIG
jgi:RimJ/RimL family protein N-acetyltransferase